VSPEPHRLEVSAAFVERTGRAPEGLWAAPGRVNLMGEHTDYNDGFVLPLAIDRQVVAAAGRRTDGGLRMWSLQGEDEPVCTGLDELAPGSVKGWAAYVAGVAWALGEERVPIGGADIVVSGNVPVGAGLGSSAALECVTGLAFDDLYGVGMSPVEWALLAQRAENEYVGVPCGAMDQMASTLGRAGFALFLDTWSLQHEQVPLRLDAAGLSLLVIDTGVGHRLAQGEYADRRQACESVADELGVAVLRDLRAEELADALARLDDERAGQVRHVVTENGRVPASAAAPSRWSRWEPPRT
jgi:galactokinase